MEAVKTDMRSQANTIEKGFNKIEITLNEQEKENRLLFDKLWHALDEINVAIKLHEYRLNQLDRNRQQTTGDKSAI